MSFTFTLEAVTAGTPEEIRVRRYLKRLGKKYGLKVTWPEPASGGAKSVMGRDVHGGSPEGDEPERTLRTPADNAPAAPGDALAATVEGSTHE